MDLVVFENNKLYVIDEFREGRFDYVELASDVAETKFFQFLFGQQVVDRLVQHYPSPRDRHHVPLWMYVCSQLSLRLHGQHSFHSYPLIVRRRIGRCSGLGGRTSPDRSRKRQSHARMRGLQRPQPLSPPDALRSGLPPQAGPRHRAGAARGSGTTATSSPCTRNSGRSTLMACSLPTAPTCSCPTTLITRVRNGCSSTSTTIPSARNRNRR